MQAESPQVGLNPVGNRKFLRKENVEGCQILVCVGAPDQKTGDTGRVVWVDWDLRAERRRQSEGAWEAPFGKGTEVAGGLCKHSRSCWQREMGRGPTRVCDWKKGCHVPSLQESRQLLITQAAVQDCMETSPDQGL